MPRVENGASGFCEVHGASLEWRWAGPAPAAAPTLVFLHEGLGSAAQWRDLPDVLAQRCGYGALVYSRAGYGRSSPVAGPWPLSFMHREALEVLPELLAGLGVLDPVLFGHSDGASIALVYAGAGCVPRPRALIVEAPHLFVEPICLASIARLAERFSAATPEGEKLRAGFERHHGAQASETVSRWTEVWLSPGFVDWSIETFLARIASPILAIQGTEDAYGTPLQLERLAALAPSVETHLLAGSGHSPHRDRRSDVLSLAHGFLTRLAG